MVSIKNILMATLLMSGTLLALGAITARTNRALLADEPSSEIDPSLAQNQTNTSVEKTQSDNSSEQAVFD